MNDPGKRVLRVEITAETASDVRAALQVEHDKKHWYTLSETRSFRAAIDAIDKAEREAAP